MIGKNEMYTAITIKIGTEYSDDYSKRTYIARPREYAVINDQGQVVSSYNKITDEIGLNLYCLKSAARTAADWLNEHAGYAKEIHTTIVTKHQAYIAELKARNV